MLLTDVVMPGMTGRELAQRLTEARPDVRVVYMSGYAEDVIAHRGRLEPGVAFVAKPFAPSDLVAKIRDALGEHRQGRVSGA